MILETKYEKRSFGITLVVFIILFVWGQPGPKVVDEEFIIEVKRRRI